MTKKNLNVRKIFNMQKKHDQYRLELSVALKNCLAITQKAQKKRMKFVKGTTFVVVAEMLGHLNNDMKCCNFIV